MGWVNNGTARSLKITVTKTVGGNQSTPETIYNGQLGGSTWGYDDVTYPPLTDEEIIETSEIISELDEEKLSDLGIRRAGPGGRGGRGRTGVKLSHSWPGNVPLV